MNNFFKYILLLGSLVWLSCSSSLEEPDLIKPEDVLNLSIRGKTQLNANNSDRTTLIARIPKDAGEIDITFKTTAGSFISSGAKEVKEFADSVNENYRYARTILKSDTTIGPVYLTAEIPQARRRYLITFIK